MSAELSSSPIPDARWRRAAAVIAFLTPLVFAVTREESAFRFTPGQIGLVLLAMAAALAGRLEWRRVFANPLLMIAGVAMALGIVSQPSAGAVLRFVQAFGLLAAAYAIGVSAFGAGLRLGLALAASATALWGLVQFAGHTEAFFVRAGLPNNQAFALFLILAFPFAVAEIARRCRPAIALAIGASVLLVASLPISDFGLVTAFAIGGGATLALAIGSRTARVIGLGVAVAILVANPLAHPAQAARFFTASEYADIASAYARGAWLAKYEPTALASLPGDRQLRAAFLPFRPEPPVAFDHATDPTILKQRYAEWIAAGRMALHYPLTGVGLGRYQSHIGEHYSPMPKLNTSDPDTQNGWLVVASSLGIPAALALLLLALAPGAVLMARREHPAAEDIAAPAAALGLVMAGAWAPFLQTGLLLPLGMVLGLAHRSVGIGWSTVAANALTLPRQRPLAAAGLAAAVLLLTAAVWLRPKPEQRDLATASYIWIEAEAAAEVSEPMRTLAAGDASGGGAIELPDGVGTGWRNEAGGHAKWTFTIPAAMKANIWARVWWADGCGNALFVTANGGERLIMGNDAEFRRWHWVSVPDVALRAGPNELLFGNREDGIRVDKLLVTDDDTFRPQGLWSAAYTQRFGKGEPTGWDREPAAAWQNRTAAEEPALGTTSEQGMLLLQQPLTGDYSARVRLTLMAPEASVMLLHFYEDPDNFTAARLRADSAAIVRVQRGEEQILAEDRSPAPHASWIDATLESRGGVLTATVPGRAPLRAVDRRVLSGRFGLRTSGDVAVASAMVEPLEVIALEQDLTAGTETEFGTDSWSNYRLDLAVGGGDAAGFAEVLRRPETQRLVRIERREGTWVMTSVEKGTSVAETILSGDAAAETLTLRCFEDEIQALLDGHPAGRLTARPGEILHGSVRLAPGIAKHVSVGTIRRFYDGFGGCDGNNMASWTTVGGEWRVLATPALGATDALGQFLAQGGTALAGEAFWENYDFGVMLRPAESPARFLYSYTSNADHSAIRLVPGDSEQAGRIEVTRTTEGATRVLASAPWEVEPGAWYEIEQQTTAAGTTVTVNGETALTLPEPLRCRGRIGVSAEGAGAFFDNARVDFY